MAAGPRWRCRLGLSLREFYCSTAPAFGEITAGQADCRWCCRRTWPGRCLQAIALTLCSGHRSGCSAFRGLWPRFAQVTSDPSGRLTLGHVFGAAGVEPKSVLALRHTYNSDGLASASDVTPEKVLRYTRQQRLRNKVGPQPPGIWLVFMADGGRRARFFNAYENRGEVLGERTAQDRFFDLRPSSLLYALQDRLVVEWSKDAVNWAKLGPAAAGFPIVEIADPVEVPFPGFDRLLVSFDELLAVVEDRRYASWRTALSAVQGIYLIADDTNGQLYVGKADGGERIFGRWAAYARDGHGGNLALKQLAGLNPGHASSYRFSLLQVFGPATPAQDIDAAESHFKEALLTRTHGMNRN